MNTDVDSDDCVQSYLRRVLGLDGVFIHVVESFRRLCLRDDDLLRLKRMEGLEGRKRLKRLDNNVPWRREMATRQSNC